MEEVRFGASHLGDEVCVFTNHLVISVRLKICATGCFGLSSEITNRVNITLPHVTMAMVENTDGKSHDGNQLNDELGNNS